MEITEKGNDRLVGCLKKRYGIRAAESQERQKNLLKQAKNIRPQSIKYCEGAAARTEKYYDMVEHYIKTLQLTRSRQMTNLKFGKKYATTERLQWI